jgi:hypothetical protein
MDPSKKRPKVVDSAASEVESQEQAPPKDIAITTERDREYALADAEWKNLWDATEVIDMDKW